MTASNPFDLTGRVAVVTGGNGGLGRAMALGLARAGASVAILGRNPDKNAATLKELEATGRPCCALQVDVQERDRLQGAVDDIEKRLGPVDILVNNAGISVPGGILKLEPGGWDQVLEINLTSVYLLSRIVARGMAERKRGKIINITSEYALFGAAVFPAYSASKGGLEQLTRSMAIELAPHNIQVNALAPGWIETDMTAPARGHKLWDEIISRTPAGRWGKPGDLAGTAVYLAAPASDFVTGATLFVDGGYSIR